MNPTILVVFNGDAKYERATLAPLNPHIVHVPDFDHPDVLDTLPIADAIMFTLHYVGAAIMDRAPKCKILSRLGVGYDNIDIPAATARGMWVSYVPDYGIDEVAAHAIALMMEGMRSVGRQSAEVKSGKWQSNSAAPVKRMCDSVFGVLGFGRIGREAGKKALGLGMRVVAYDPLVSADAIAATGCEPASFERVLQASDYVTLHTPLSENTRHLINAKTLSMMKPDAFLINTARGGLVDETALLDALNHGIIRGAGLDVFNTEPAPPDHPLVAHPRVVVTPHAAFYSEEAMRDLHVRGSEEVVRVLTGGTPRCPLNKVNRTAINLTDNTH
jgi:phosphoglycerate dehydrogenase-like enzyme